MRRGKWIEPALPTFTVDLPLACAYPPCMPTKSELLDLQFIEARHKLIDLAAFLDRIERHDGPTDFRHEALKNALPILLSDQPNRARAILEALSDPTAEPIDSPPPPACGAPLKTEN